MVSRELSEEFPKNDLLLVLDLINCCRCVNNEADFLELVNCLASFIDYDFAICGLAKVKKKELKSVVGVFNISYPEEWNRIYFKNGFQHVDPIVRTHFSTFEPQIWSETFQKFPDIHPAFLSMAKDFKLCEGLTHGMMGYGSHVGSLFSFSGPSIKPSRRHLVILELIIPHMHQAMIRIFQSKKKKRATEEGAIPFSLSFREEEIINWVKEGKTNWEISRILNISERTVKFHVSNLMRKLDATTRSHAVAKAIELEVIGL